MWGLIALAFVAANLPFLWSIFRRTPKRDFRLFAKQFLSVLVLYGLVGGVAYWMESQMGPVKAQNWQFYVTTFSLFLVFAFPGYVACYFWPNKR